VLTSLHAKPACQDYKYGLHVLRKVTVQTLSEAAFFKKMKDKQATVRESPFLYRFNVIFHISWLADTSRFDIHSKDQTAIFFARQKRIQ
jgi:hypothetical protein